MTDVTTLVLGDGDTTTVVLASDATVVSVTDAGAESTEITFVGEIGPQGPQGEGSEEAIALLEAHLADTTPHTAYDVDIPSLSLIFENHLV